jgi:hypothetical protein
MLTEEEKQRGTAHHEAGHAILTIVSRFFQLTDPAIILAPTPDRTAQSGTRPRKEGLLTTKEMGLEHVEIALAGKAGELLLERISATEGRRITLHADSCEDDFALAASALKYYEAEGEFQRLLYSASACLEQHRKVWEEVASLVMQRMGHQDSLSKHEVESLPGVQELMKKKRPL